jgi:hypothetical protein
MDRWLRIAAVAAGALVGALFLRMLPPVIVLAAFVVGAFVVTRTLKTRIRHEAVAGEAATLGLRLEPTDPFGLLGFPLSLFGRGTDGRIEEVRWGTWRGVDVKAFGYSYAPAVPAIGSTAGGTDHRGRFVCAIAAIPPVRSPIVAEPVSFVLGLGAHAPMGEVDLDHGAAASSFVVRCDDPDLARTLLEGVAGEWLVEGGEEWGFEASGQLLLIYGEPASAPSVPDVLGRLHDLRSRLVGGAPGEAVVDPEAAGTV